MILVLIGALIAWWSTNVVFSTYVAATAGNKRDAYILRALTLVGFIAAAILFYYGVT